jgi:hypothetical protein
MKSRRSFLKFLALAPVAISATVKAVALNTPPAAAAATVGRGLSPLIIQCDEFGNPYPTHYQHSPELKAQIDAMRVRHSNANVDALFRHNDYLQKLSAKHHVSAG